MKLLIKTPFAEMSFEGTQEQMMFLLQQAANCAAGQVPAVTEPVAPPVAAAPVASAPEPAKKETPQAPKSRVEAMFGPRDTWGIPKTESKREENGAEPKESYKGFLLLRCEKCGKVKAFCAKFPMTYHQCECGHRTELHDLKPVHAHCECGGNYSYKTNVQDEQFSINCIDCQSPIDLELNSRRNTYITIGYKSRAGGGY